MADLARLVEEWDLAILVGIGVAAWHGTPWLRKHKWALTIVVLGSFILGGWYLAGLVSLVMS